MTTHNVFGSGNYTNLVDEMIGNAYPTVKHVAMNMEYVKHISHYMPQLFTMHENLPMYQGLYNNIPQFTILYNNINALLVLEDNINDIVTLRNNLSIIAAINANMPIIQANKDYIQDFATRFGNVDTAIAATEAARAATEAILVQAQALYERMQALGIDTSLPIILSSAIHDVNDSTPYQATAIANKLVTWAKGGIDAALVTLNGATGVWFVAPQNAQSKPLVTFTLTATDTRGNVSAVQIIRLNIIAVILDPGASPQPLYQTINYNQQHTFGGRTYVVTSAENEWNIKRSTNYNLTKFEVRNQDLRTGDPTDRERAELSGSPFGFTGIEEIWIHYAMFPIELDASWWTSLFQLFGLASSGNTVTGPVLKLEHNNGGTETEVNIAGNIDNSVRVQLDLWKASIFEENKIYYMTWKIAPHGTQAKAGLWINGELQFEMDGLPIGFGTNPLNYVKYGIYRDVDPGGDQPPCVVIFNDPEYAVGVNALRGKITNPTLMPYYDGKFPLGNLNGAVVYSAVAAPQLNLIPANWTKGIQAGSTIVENPIGTFALTGGGTSSGASLDQAIITEVGVTKKLNITITDSSASVRIGTTMGDEQIMPLTSFVAGVHGIVFTPVSNKTWIRINKQAIQLTTVSNMFISTGVALPNPTGPELNTDPDINDPTQYVIYGSGKGATAVAASQMNVDSTTSSWAFRIRKNDTLFPAGNYRISMNITNWLSGAFSPCGHATDPNVISTGNSQLNTLGDSGNGLSSWDITTTVPMYLGIRGRSGITKMSITDLSIKAF
jgi:hypothetical protein